MKLGAFLLFGRTKRPDLHRSTARPRFSPLSAGSSVLDALWIVTIILEQPAYALVVPKEGQIAAEQCFMQSDPEQRLIGYYWVFRRKS
jgi:hypothetical protein